MPLDSHLFQIRLGLFSAGRLQLLLLLLLLFLLLLLLVGLDDNVAGLLLLQTYLGNGVGAALRVLRVQPVVPLILCGLDRLLGCGRLRRDLRLLDVFAHAGRLLRRVLFAGISLVINF